MGLRGFRAVSDVVRHVRMIAAWHSYVSACGRTVVYRVAYRERPAFTAARTNGAARRREAWPANERCNPNPYSADSVCALQVKQSTSALHAARPAHRSGTWLSLSPQRISLDAGSDHLC
jgi:hypothetical protein